MKVVLFNGPRKSGKDTLAQAFANRIDHRVPVSCMKMATPMHEAALAEYDLGPHMVAAFESVKDEPQPQLGGKTPRKVYIDYGNNLRAKHGPDVLGNMWIERVADIVNHERGWILVPDVRFQPEVNAAVRIAGASNVMLMYVVRTGCTWDGDIGRYCDHDWSCTFINTGSLDGLGGRVEQLLERSWQ